MIEVKVFKVASSKILSLNKKGNLSYGYQGVFL